ncbi:MAG TPA: dephospho-CoA kinase [Flavipsychrobacter sp.]|nr:dephospho-CoA kinase [Flavipsychrobacter sp.]
MLKTGITGGIGSGKTIVCQVFETLGIPVFYADAAAKLLMEQDDHLILQIKSAFGDAIYKGKQLDRENMASIVFNDSGKLNILNSFVHPAVLKYSNEWMEQQTSPYALKEAAILFESNNHKTLDAVIGVYAPKALRIQRAMHRDGATREKIEARIAKQMNEEEKMKLCDYVIINDGIQAIIPQVLHIHSLLLEKSQSS